MNAPMNAWPDELRLIAVLVTNALMLGASYRLARRTSPRLVVALPDTLLYWLAAQYVFVGVCGMLGLLWPGVILGVGCVASIMAIVLFPSPSGRGVRGEGLSPWHRTSEIADVTPSPRPSPKGSGGEDRIVLAALAFVVAFAGAIVWHQRPIPELATDPLVYHIPIAARWVQDGRISLVDLWYWLPANAYSPIAGSCWIAWWLAPIGNDSLSRFVQMPTWLLLFAASLRLLRDLRVPIVAAGLAAVAVVLARPFLTQLAIAKDDIGVAALAITLLGGLHARRLNDSVAPVRLGIAFGLLISIKYPAILALVVAAPAILTFRWWRAIGLRGTLIAGAISLAFVAPWLIRNAILTGGNPVYPFFAGNGGFFPDPDLRTASGIWHLLAGSNHSPRPLVWTLFGVAAVVFIVANRRRLLARDDGVRLTLLVGPPLAIVTLIVTFPWPEIRYLYSAVAGLLILVGVAFGRLADRRASIALCAVALLIVFGSAYDVSVGTGWTFFATACVGGTATFAIATFLSRTTPSVRQGLALTTGGVALVAIYVLWNAYLYHPDVGYRRSTDETWVYRYEARGQAWATLREKLPPGTTIAYANTPTIWPLFGFDLRFRVVHAPVCPGVRHLHDLPPVPEKVPAREQYITATRITNDGADAQTWLANLDRLRADYLFVAKDDASRDPPELTFIAQHPTRFEPVFENEAALLLRIRR